VLTSWVRAARRAALLLVLASPVTCGDDGPPQCQHPADCATVQGADSCKMVKGRGVCVLACAVANGQDSCPSPFHCTASSDDGNKYCTSNP
jgi:hypothetical protein